jgi:hypothetical protein
MPISLKGTATANIPIRCRRLHRKDCRKGQQELEEHDAIHIEYLLHHELLQQCQRLASRDVGFCRYFFQQHVILRKK